MGKRARNSGFQGALGKRAWNSGFQGALGKRNLMDEEEEEDQLIASGDLQVDPFAVHQISVSRVLILR
jgi:hypothetical protein